MILWFFYILRIQIDYLTDENFKVLDKQVEFNPSTNFKRVPSFIKFGDDIVFPCGFSRDYLAYNADKDCFSMMVLADHQTCFDTKTEEKLVKDYGDNYTQEISSYILNCRQTCVQGKFLLDYLYEGKRYWSLYDTR